MYGLLPLHVYSLQHHARTNLLKITADLCHKESGGEDRQNNNNFLFCIN